MNSMPCLKPHLLMEVIDMAIRTYKKDNKIFYSVSVHTRGNEDTSLRFQKKRINIETLREAQRLERKLLAEIIEKVAKIEGRGLTWGEIINRWEIQARMGYLGDQYFKNYPLIQSHVNRLNRYTKIWLDRRAYDLTKGDGRQILNAAKVEGAKPTLLKHIKGSINLVYQWAIEERHVVGVHSSPVVGLSVVDKVEKAPKILTLDEIRTLLSMAHEKNHSWYPIWAFALLTGMRSGELRALQWRDIDLEKRIIIVSKSFNPHLRKIKCTKAGYWRNVPISIDLERIIQDLKGNKEPEPDGFVLPSNYNWTNGTASDVLRNFLRDIGIDKDIVFHTLRACFATHMLAQGVDQATVMKVGGWRDLKTFQIYVRLAGIEVKGATDVLDVLPKMQPVIKSNIVNFKSFSKHA